MQPWHQAGLLSSILHGMGRIGNKLTIWWLRMNTAGAAAQSLQRGAPMLYWALVFLVIAIIAGLFGFGGIASASAGIAQILFVVFLILLAVSLVMYFVRGRRPPA